MSDGRYQEQTIGAQAAGTAATIGVPWPERGVLVEWKATADDDWTPRADLIPISAQLHAASNGFQKAEVLRYFGDILAPRTTAFVEQSPNDLAGTWVRISLTPPPESGQWGSGDPSGVDAQSDLRAIADTGADPVFVGFVVAMQDAPQNVGADETDRGRQTYVCAGADRLLEMMLMNNTGWAAATAVALDRLPGFNVRSDAGRIYGNRSDEPVEGAYLFGGLNVWTNRQMIDYLVRHHVQRYERDILGNRLDLWPIWTIGGQIDALDGLAMPVAIRRGQSIFDLMRQIIAPRWGLDFTIDPTDEGFEIFIYAMQREPVTAAGYTLPGNPYLYELDLTDAPDVQVEFETARNQFYDRVRVIGQPIVTTFSAGSGAEMSKANVWTAAQETAYEYGAGLGDLDDQEAKRKNDAVRADDRFADVFAAWRLVWGTWQNGAAYPRCGDDGTLIYAAVPYQYQERSTRPKLALLDGYDYSTSPPTWTGDDDAIPQFRNPLAWATCPHTSRRVRLDALPDEWRGERMSPAALAHEWGIRVRATPNHFLGRGSVDLTYPSAHDPSNDEPGGLAYATVGFTISIESDHRVQVAQELPADVQFGQGLELVVEVDDAELWILAPSTVVGVAADGTLETSPAAVVLLRDDREYLKKVLAGAVARYLRERRRASVQFAALEPIGLAIGMIFETVTTGGVERLVNAPVSGVAWDFQRRTSRLLTGQAER